MVSFKDDEAAMWAEYKRTESKESFDVLVEHYMPYARDRAERLRNRLPSHADLDDLFQDACIGLMQAVRMFRPGGAASFMTYARRRVGGAMSDALRSQDWVPRLARERQKKARAICASLEYELGREPTDDEVFTALPATLRLRDEDWSTSLRQKYSSWAKGDTHPVSVTSLDGPWGEDEEVLGVLGRTPDDRFDAPDAALRLESLKALVRLHLTPEEKVILELYYYQGLPMWQIGEKIGLGMARISQIHKAMLPRLKKYLAGREDEFAV